MAWKADLEGTVVGRLSSPLEPERVAQRSAGGGRQVPYIEAWDAIAAANAIFGYGGWSYRVLRVADAFTTDVQRRDELVRVVLYAAEVEVRVGDVIRVDVGTGITADASPEAHETAIKGAASDGLKRALRTFGTQFGLELYDKSGAARRSQAAQRPQDGRGDAQARPATQRTTAAQRARQEGAERREQAATGPAGGEPDGPAWAVALRAACREANIGQAHLSAVLGETADADAIERWLRADPQRTPAELVRAAVAKRGADGMRT